MGSGDLKALQFESQSASLNMVGSGDADISLQKDWKVCLFGNRGDRYKGDPTVQKHGFGFGSVKKGDSAA